MSDVMQVFGAFTKEANAESQAQAGTNVNYLSKLPVGLSTLRICPPAAGRSLPWVVTWQHFIRLPGLDSPIVFNCPEKMGGGACPACTQMRALETTGNPADFDAAKQYAPQFRVFANVIDRSNPTNGPMLWGFGITIFRRLTSFRENDAVCGEDFTHPLHGRDIIVNRSGTGKTDTRYQVDLSSKQTPLAETNEQMIAWGGEMASLDKSGYVPTWDEINARVAQAKEKAGQLSPGHTAQMQAQAQNVVPATASAPQQPSLGDVVSQTPSRDDDKMPF